MNRKSPYELYSTIKEGDKLLELLSCSTLSLSCAMANRYTPEDRMPTLEDIKRGIHFYHEGYRSLKDMNKVVRFMFNVRKYRYFTKKERVPLKKIKTLGGERAIICVLGHYIYVENDNYYSFFNNDNDLVVAIWFLGD